MLICKTSAKSNIRVLCDSLMRAEEKWSLKSQQMKHEVIPPNLQNFEVDTYLSSKLAKKEVVR